MTSNAKSFVAFSWLTARYFQKKFSWKNHQLSLIVFVNNGNRPGKAIPFGHKPWGDSLCIDFSVNLEPSGNLSQWVTRSGINRSKSFIIPNLYNNYSMSTSWIWSDKITNELVARVGYNHFISNKGDWNNCYGKFSNRVLPPIFISTILQSVRKENF